MTLAARAAVRASLLVLFMFITSHVFAQNQPAMPQGQAVPPGIRVFASQYVMAFNSKDPRQLLALQHPTSLACITPENKDYYDGALAMQMRDSVPANYTVSVMTPNEGNLKALESMGMRWPLKPEQEVHIDYQEGEDATGIVVYLVRQNGRWFGDFPCATDATIKQFRDGAAERQAAAARYKAIADGIKEPLRSELIGLLRAHETGRATERYRNTSGQDGRTSMLVMDALRDEIR
jgi:hypothetical protein